MISMIITCYWVNPTLIDTTIDCLNSLNDTTDSEPEEVLIIDDGSPIEFEFTDNTDFIQQFRTISRENNGGYAAAVNTGLYYAKGDPIIVCNNDIKFIQPNWLKHLTQPLKEGYDISSIRTTDSDGWATEDAYEIDAKFGSIWAMKRKVYQALGGLDEGFGKGYFEDLDYHERAKQAGFKVVKNHAGIVEHQGKATFKEIDPEDKTYSIAKTRFIRKHGKLW